MTDRISFRAESRELITKLFQDFNGTFEELFAFAEKHTQDGRLLIKLLMLGSELHECLIEDGGIQLSARHNEMLAKKAEDIIAEIAANPINPNDSFFESLSKLEYRYEKTETGPVFEAKDVTKDIGDFSISPISFKLELGKITSIVGRNGNGKSTLLRLIAGEIRADGGEILYSGRSTVDLDWMKIKQKIAYISQDIPRWPQVTSLREHLHYTASMKGIRGAANTTKVSFIIARLGLEKYLDYAWSDISGGYRLRFELARQLVWSPQLLIMDEPLAHLDIEAQDTLLDDLRNLANSMRTPIAIVLTSQSLYNIENISDNIIFLNNGKAEYNGPIGNIADKHQKRKYILESEESIAEIRKSLEPLSDLILEFKEMRNEVIITGDRELVSSMIISALIAGSVTIKNFRDISNSTRIFFEDDRNF